MKFAKMLCIYTISYQGPHCTGKTGKKGLELSVKSVLHMRWSQITQIDRGKIRGQTGGKNRPRIVCQVSIAYEMVANYSN